MDGRALQGRGGRSRERQSPVALRLMALGYLLRLHALRIKKGSVGEGSGWGEWRDGWGGSWEGRTVSSITSLSFGPPLPCFLPVPFPAHATLFPFSRSIKPQPQAPQCHRKPKSRQTRRLFNRPPTGPRQGNRLGTRSVARPMRSHHRANSSPKGKRGARRRCSAPLCIACRPRPPPPTPQPHPTNSFRFFGAHIIRLALCSFPTPQPGVSSLGDPPLNSSNCPGTASVQEV